MWGDRHGLYGFAISPETHPSFSIPQLPKRCCVFSGSTARISHRDWMRRILPSHNPKPLIVPPGLFDRSIEDKTEAIAHQDCEIISPFPTSFAQRIKLE